MKHSPSLYARAFALSALARRSDAKAGPATDATLVKNLIALVRKNGDAKDLPKIAAEAGRLLREKEGIRKFTIESARPLSTTLRDALRGMAGQKDVVHEKVDPSLVAGVRVTVDDDRRFDATLARRLQKMLG